MDANLVGMLALGLYMLLTGLGILFKLNIHPVVMGLLATIAGAAILIVTLGLG